MSCRYCANFFYLDSMEYDDKRGKCTLYPTWIDVTDAHHCGQISVRTHYDGQSPMEHLGNELVELRGEIGRYRERAIKAEKQAKELRAKLREVKK